MTTSSSSAAEKDLIMKFIKRSFIFFVMLLICFSLFYLNQNKNNKYILKTLELNGSFKEGDTLFKMNCVGCHGTVSYTHPPSPRDS